MGIFSAKQDLIRSAPGSDITGVPESEINAIAFFLESFSIRWGIVFFELNLWKDFNFDFIPNLLNSFLLILVSSHNTRSTVDNILSDLISSYEFFLKKLRIILERVKIDVYVASLNDEKKKIINDELVNIWGQNLEINYNLDVSIIGGIILQVEDKLYDGSIRGKLEKFNNI